MKRFRLKPTKADPLRRARLDELLQIARAFQRAGRSIPGHVRREMVFLSDLWGQRTIPPEVIEARRTLAGVRP